MEPKEKPVLWAGVWVTASESLPPITGSFLSAYSESWRKGLVLVMEGRLWGSVRSCGFPRRGHGGWTLVLEWCELAKVMALTGGY